MNGELLIAMAAEAQRMRDQYYRPDPWWIVFPPRFLPRVAELKESYVRWGMHGSNGLRGIEFPNEWPVIGQRFTYDIGTRTWDR